MNYQQSLSLFQEILGFHLNKEDLSVGKKINPKELLSKMDFSVPVTSVGLERVILDAKDYLQYTPNTNSPQFQNQLFSGINPYALLGEWISTFTNSTMATYEVAPVATIMEKKLIQHVNKKIGWADGDGIMVTGGSNANFVAMLVARNNRFPETKTHGNQDKKLTAFISEEAHYSFEKAANMMGLGISSIKKIPSDENGKMNVLALKESIVHSISAGELPYFIGATAGTTVLGAYDPILEISTVAKEFGLWLHVDGAWGGGVLLSKKHRDLMNGISSADSLTLDTHKMLGTGLISSFFLTRHKHTLRTSNHSGGTNYIFHENDSSAWDSGPSSLQCGRRVDALKVWLTWRALGDEGLEKMVDDLFENVQTAKRYILSHSELELIAEPQMLNLCFAFKNPSVSITQVREKLLGQGDFYINISTRKEKTFFRMIIVNPNITESVIVNSIDTIIELKKDL